MPFPLIPVIAGASAGASLLGNLLNRPQRSTFDPNAIYRRIEAANNSALHSSLGTNRAGLGANLAAQGIRGGAAAQAMGNMEGVARGQVAGQNAKTLAELLGQKYLLDDKYNEQKSDWLGSILGNIGQAGGAVAGTMLGVQGQKKLTEEELAFFLERMKSLQNNDPNFMPRILAGGSNRTGGWNPASSADSRRGFDLEELSYWNR